LVVSDKSSDTAAAATTAAAVDTVNVTDPDHSSDKTVAKQLNYPQKD